MSNFTYRRLVGNYKGGHVGLGTFADFLKIDSCLRELAIDLPNLGSRLKAVENELQNLTFTTSDFVLNTINANILLEGSIQSSKLADGSITGDKLVMNSIRRIS